MKVPFIQNVAWVDIKNGNHRVSQDMVLISITDPDMEAPDTFHNFSKIYYFKFLDLEIEDKWAINYDQAEILVAILQKCLAENKDVVVHCTAGVCRSGAVSEVGEIMGFEPSEMFRIPNTRVKTKMLQALKFTYTDDEKEV